MSAKMKYDYEGRYVFVDRDGHKSQVRHVTLSLTDNYWFYISEYPKNLLELGLQRISAAKKEKNEWSSDYFIRFLLPLSQQVIFWCHFQEKTDELIKKFNALKRKQEKEDETKVGEV